MQKIFRNSATLFILAIGLCGVLFILYAWQLPPFRSSVQMTENAYVRGQVTIISPQLAGYIKQVPERDYLRVKKGDVLFALDDRIYVQKLKQAEAMLETQKASLANSEQDRLAAKARTRSGEAVLNTAKVALNVAEANYNRVTPLRKSGVMTQSNEDQSLSALEQARGAVSQAEAALEVNKQDVQSIIVRRHSLEAAVTNAEAAVDLARIDLSNTKIIAPQDGVLGEIGAKPGQYVNIGAQLTNLVPDKKWIIANFKETQFYGMKAGLPVTFTVDALNHEKMIGHIEAFSPATGSEFSVLKADNATGNFIKVTQRLPVRIAIDGGQEQVERLMPGMSVIVKVDTRVAAE
ncbi:HlyD family secretion protein [Pseudochrobactrum saccharolyticum]|uniref:Multidrug resistance efflux pump n=1 Tax=Pseudochrobactrum saccharolyticum TaxID=354352 RepID=A0A7W8ALY7_9HYPH|nr:HlyD family secretion protein [Pseudochrobactrum saccharolyticum]KAB0539873.1 HlyD family secretion protein [Pseudochrobactrum saccharolyticum]MBB5092782.1 multidrug resistance efflux pump [Pseudochrobactrum saccharolyticum]MDP8251208.1 HlyD family secretion protein [Pseudochrobactrum saccharolyticum]